MEKDTLSEILEAVVARGGEEDAAVDDSGDGTSSESVAPAGDWRAFRASLIAREAKEKAEGELQLAASLEALASSLRRLGLGL